MGGIANSGASDLLRPSLAVGIALIGAPGIQLRRHSACALCHMTLCSPFRLVHRLLITCTSRAVRTPSYNFVLKDDHLASFMSAIMIEYGSLLRT